MLVGSGYGFKNFEFGPDFIKVISIIWFMFHPFSDFLYFFNGFVFVFHIEILIHDFFHLLN